MVMRARCGRRSTAWRRALNSRFSLSLTLATDPAPKHLERAYGSGGRKCRRGRRLDCGAHLGRRRMRHLGYPAGITLPQETRAGRLPYWQTLDASEHRQCAGWSRDSPASAGVGDEYRRARSVDQEGPLSVSQRARYGIAGCNARSGPQLSGTPGPVPVAVHIDRIGWPTLRERSPSAFPAPGLTLIRRTSPR